MEDAIFDLNVEGTTDPAWNDMLTASPQWRPREGSPLLVVAPRPDDETLGAGGLISMWAEADAASRAALPPARTGRSSGAAAATPRVTILSVTDGEAAQPHSQDSATIRRAEMRRALSQLSQTGGDAIAVVHLSLPDGQVNQYQDRLARAIRENLAAGATLIAPFEGDGNPDNECVGRICGEIAAACQAPIARYPVWRWNQPAPKPVAHRIWGRFELSARARTAKARAVRCLNSHLRSYSDSGRKVVAEHMLRYFHRPYEAYLI